MMNKESQRLKNICLTDQVKENNPFVGVRVTGRKIEVIFPTGFTIGEKDDEIRQDILALLHALEHNKIQLESSSLSPIVQDPAISGGTPLGAYLQLIGLFLADPRLFKPSTQRLAKSNFGQVDWSRTNQQIPALFSSSGLPIHHQFVVKKTVFSNDSLISQIHHFYLWKSFKLLGWLYTSYVPPRPVIRFNRSLFLSCIYQHLDSTFNDQTRRVLKCLELMVLAHNSDENEDLPNEISFGTSKFEYVWEGLVDKVFGISKKDLYFPRATWVIDGLDQTMHAPLKPDSIMVHGKNIFVLDAKYYKFGATGMVRHLPGNADIGKQVLYGQHAEKVSRPRSVYNAFILPGHVEGNRLLNSTNIGTAVPNWIDRPKLHELIQTIVVDTKTLVYASLNPVQEVKENLALSFKLLPKSAANP